ncbi:MAG: DinB family protein [Acidobacteria bacterium]|nr:DinB family protein [Acidobacteriota bacterium]
MTKGHVRHAARAMAIIAGLTVTALHAQQNTAPAQPAKIQATLAADMTTLSDKFTGLARVMAGKYDWKPGQGVRSVTDVFNLIVSENRMLNNVLTGAAGQGRGGGMSGNTPVTDPAQLQADLKSTYDTLRQTIAGLSDADLNAPVRLFGRDTTKLGASLMLLFDQHEHLGQSIAYARSNAVVPPWSK